VARFRNGATSKRLHVLAPRSELFHLKQSTRKTALVQPRLSAKRLNACHVAIIGAGPYGLSVAAHLRQAAVSTHVFGEPMSFWRQHMPKGMRLRSPWRASHLSDPAGALSLDALAGDRADPLVPLPLETFAAYGLWFQERAVPDVDRRMVRVVSSSGDGFQLELTDGDVFTAKRRRAINQRSEAGCFRHKAFCDIGRMRRWRS